MDPITIEKLDTVLNQIKDERRYWTLRSCSICDTPLNYVFQAGFVGYNSNCNCSRFTSEIAPVSRQEFLETFNRQTPDVRQRMWQAFLKSVKINADGVIGKSENMTFSEAMILAYNHRLGSSHKMVFITRPSLNRCVYYGATATRDELIPGFLYMLEKDTPGGVYSPSIEDINASDWKVVESNHG